MWKIIWTTNAELCFRRLEVTHRSKIRAAIEEIILNPVDEENGRIRKLWGELSSLYRYQVGKTHIVYRIVEDDNSVRIIAIDTGRK